MNTRMTSIKSRIHDGIVSTSRKQQYDKVLFLYALLGLFFVSRIVSICCMTSYFSYNRSVLFDESQGIVVIEPWCTINQTDIICRYRKTNHNRPVNLLPISSNNSITDKAIVVANVDGNRKQALHLLMATRSFNAGLKDRQHRDHRLQSIDNNKHATSLIHHSPTLFTLMKQQRIHASTSSAFASSLISSSLYSKPTFLSISLQEAQVMVRTAVVDAMEKLRIWLHRLFHAFSTTYSTSQMLWTAFTSGIAVTFIMHVTKLLPEHNGRIGEDGVLEIKYGGINRGFRESIHVGIREGVVTKWPKPLAGHRSLSIVHRK